MNMTNKQIAQGAAGLAIIRPFDDYIFYHCTVYHGDYNGGKGESTGHPSSSFEMMASNERGIL